MGNYSEFWQSSSLGAAVRDRKGKQTYCCNLADDFLLLVTPVYERMNTIRRNQDCVIKEGSVNCLISITIEPMSFIYSISRTSHRYLDEFLYYFWMM